MFKKYLRTLFQLQNKKYIEKDRADLTQTIIIIAGLAVAAIVAIGSVSAVVMEKGEQTANCIANNSPLNPMSPENLQQGCITEEENSEEVREESEWELVDITEMAQGFSLYNTEYQNDILEQLEANNFQQSVITSRSEDEINKALFGLNSEELYSLTPDEQETLYAEAYEKFTVKEFYEIQHTRSNVGYYYPEVENFVRKEHSTQVSYCEDDMQGTLVVTSVGIPGCIVVNEEIRDKKISVLL